MSEPVDNAATVLAMHCGRDSPDASDYRAAAKAAFNEVDRLRRDLAEARKDAERYRYVRDVMELCIGDAPPTYLTGKEADNFIDAAIADMNMP